jgi:hypothetical protein
MQDLRWISISKMRIRVDLRSCIEPAFKQT